MGKITGLTTEQKQILDVFKKNSFLLNNFYFTGGTALSTVYLHHRESDDIDFFSPHKHDPNVLNEIIADWSKKLHAEVSTREGEVVTVIIFTFPNKKQLKVDFGYYPYRALEPRKKIDGIPTDSLIDIATNKLLTISQRTAVKDFVDLYFLLQDTYLIWDLMEGVRIKFRQKIELVFLSTDFAKVEEFESMPRMIKPLTLKELQTFFKGKTREIMQRVVA